MGGSTLDAETQAKILRQVEFYFSDSNLPGDKFLLQAIEDAPDGLVSLPLICSFSRMRSHLGLKEHGADSVPAEIAKAVADVLCESTTLRLSEDGSKVGRVEKLKAPSEVQAEVDSRSLAICPFPWNVTLDEVESFFKELCKVNSVRLPRLAGAKCFSGFAVVEFFSEEEAERVKELKLNFQGAELESISKKAFEELQVINGQKTAKLSNGKSRHESGRGEDDEDDYPKGTVISVTLTKKGREETATDKSEEKREEADGGGIERSKDTAIDTESQVSREDIKEVLKEFGKVNFVDFSRGDKAGFVRFQLPEEAQQARAAAVLASDGGFLIKEHVVTLNPVEGEAEKDYWKKLREGQGKRRENAGRGGFSDNRGRGGRGGGKFGGKGGRGGGRGGGKRDEGRGNKHKRFDDNEDDGERKAARTD